jgi:hypothetical protein
LLNSYEFNINTNSIRYVYDVETQGSNGYNSDRSVFWCNTGLYLIEYTFNSSSDLFTEISSVYFNNAGGIVYIDNSGVWTFTGGGDLPEIGLTPDSIYKYENINASYPLFESQLPDDNFLPQIIPDGDYIWAVADDGAGRVEIVKLDPTGTLVSGCEGTQAAMSLPQTMQTYARNFGPLFLALGWIGLGRSR